MKSLAGPGAIIVLSALLSGCATGLHRAALNGDVKRINELLDKGADINMIKISMSMAGPPLHYAAFRCQTDAVKLLLERGAATDITAASWDARRSAVEGDCPRVVALLDNLNAKSAAPSVAAAPGPRLPAVRSDVDEPPAAKARQDKKAYAVVIGIESYRQGLPKADYAAADAEAVAAYLTKVLGYPEENVVTLLGDRALKSDLEKYLGRWLDNNAEEGGRVFVYYSGHGAPDPRTGDAYLVPYDGDPTFIAETGYPVSRLYESLGKLKAREVVVALDSCFSGAGGRSVIAQGAKPLVTLAKGPPVPKNLAVMTASAADQISSAYAAQGHGLFTYFFLKGLKEGAGIGPDNALQLDALYSYLKPQVERVARKQFNNEQTPQLMK